METKNPFENINTEDNEYIKELLEEYKDPGVQEIIRELAKFALNDKRFGGVFYATHHNTFSYTYSGGKTRGYLEDSMTGFNPISDKISKLYIKLFDHLGDDEGKIVAQRIQRRLENVSMES
ncbi:hypothetical protein COB64_02415 [Candidatus Wolfebacteria bacterium]|nr:MAG: hypothetical protein COB64_02415 [Candidatus Wolfebacteria bacterium]